MRRLSKEEIPGEVISGLTLTEMLKEVTLQKPPLRPYTIFVDLDGTLVEHNYDPGNKEDVFLPGAIERLRAWSEQGHMIVVTTARTRYEATRATNRIISECPGEVASITGLTAGVRVLINDRSPEGENKAFAINVNRNEGLAGVVLE